MNKIIIGTDTRSKNIVYIGTICFESKGDSFHIADHGIYFSVSHPWFKSDLLIFNNCNEYNDLIKYMNNSSPSELEEFLVPLFIRNMESPDIVNTLCYIQRQGFNEGYKKAQKHIRKSLGFDI